MRLLLLNTSFFFMLISPALTQAQRVTKNYGQIIIEEPAYMAPSFDLKMEQNKKNWRLKQIANEIKNLQTQLKGTAKNSLEAKNLQNQIDSLYTQKGYYNKLSVSASIEFAKKADQTKFEIERQKFKCVFEWLENANQNLSKKYNKNDSLNPVVRLTAVKIKNQGARKSDFGLVNIKAKSQKNLFYLGLVDSLEQVQVECELRFQSHNITEIKYLTITLFPSVQTIIISSATNLLTINTENGESLTDRIEQYLKYGSFN